MSVNSINGRTGAIENNAAEQVRILLVEDHISFRQALAFMFEREPEFTVVGQVGTVAEARRSLGGVDVVVVDLGLPDGDGTALIEDLSGAEPRITTLVLSASLDPGRFARAVEAGASGVLHKSATIKDIVDAVRRLRAGEALLSPNEVMAMLRATWRERHREIGIHQSIERLTRRELEVLRSLAEGMDSQEISERLGISVETERTHMVNIFGKLGLRSRLQALVFAVRHDIVEIR
ncbi:MAG: response regulator transcription factor [Actinomycetota bacterium]|nr:response regulator transcription factor [Actinomycetota bacterium]